MGNSLYNNARRFFKISKISINTFVNFSSSRNTNVASTERALINAFRILANMADRFQHWFMLCEQIQDQPANVCSGLSQFVGNTVFVSVFVWLLPGSICPRQLWTGLACFSRRSMMGVGWLFIFLNSGNYWFQTLLSRSDEGSVQWGNCRCLPLHSLQVPSTLLIVSTEKYGYYATPSHPPIHRIFVHES